MAVWKNLDSVLQKVRSGVSRIHQKLCNNYMAITCIETGDENPSSYPEKSRICAVSYIFILHSIPNVVWFS